MSQKRARARSNKPETDHLGQVMRNLTDALIININAALKEEYLEVAADAAEPLASRGALNL